MVKTTPHIIAGPFTELEAGTAVRAASETFGPLEAEIARNGTDRVWVLLRWPKSAPDEEARWKILGFLKGAAWASSDAQKKG
jgi:hypothetical protein